METKPFSLQSPEQIAKDYGGNKQKIAEAMQMGIVDPTAGTMAAMFIDRMRSAAQTEMAPQQTVAQQVFAPPQMSAGLGAMPPMNPTPSALPAGLGSLQGAPQAPMAPAMPLAQGMAEGGLAGLEIPDDMFRETDNYAGGGLVAFAAGTPATGVIAPATDEYGRPLTFQGAQAFYDSLGLNYNDQYEREAERQALKIRSPEEMAKARKEDLWMTLGQIGARMATTPGSLLQAASTGIQEALPQVASQRAARKLEQKQALDSLLGIEGQRYNRKGERIKSSLEMQGQAITADQAKKTRDAAAQEAKERNITTLEAARINKEGTLGAADKMYAASLEAAKKQAQETALLMAKADPIWKTATQAGQTKVATQRLLEIYNELLTGYSAANTGNPESPFGPPPPGSVTLIPPRK